LLHSEILSALLRLKPFTAFFLFTYLTKPLLVEYGHNLSKLISLSF
jgi:hypothetical protein